MGCLYSRARTSVRHTRSFATTDVNGITRVPRLVLSEVNGSYSRHGPEVKTGRSNGNARVLVKPAPPPPPSSPESSRTFNAPGLHVQYAEDLEPVEQEVPDEVRAPVLPHSNHISLSNAESAHAREATGNHVRSQGLKKTHEIVHHDLSIEELDTDTDINISVSRHVFGQNERKNPSVTDILIPRLKDAVPHGHSPTLLIRRKQQTEGPTKERYDANSPQTQYDANSAQTRHDANSAQTRHDANSTQTRHSAILAQTRQDASHTRNDVKQKQNITFMPSENEANAKPPHPRKDAKSKQLQHDAKSPHSQHGAKSPQSRHGAKLPQPRHGAKPPLSRHDAKPPLSRHDTNTANSDFNSEVLNNALPSIVRYDAGLQLTDVSSENDDDDIVSGNTTHTKKQQNENANTNIDHNLCVTLETNNSASLQGDLVYSKYAEQNTVNNSGMTVSKDTDTHKIESNVTILSSLPVPSTPKALYEQELENSRESRKRKRYRERRKAEQTSRKPKPSDAANQPADEMTLDGALKSRPASGVSILTVNSRATLVSAQTLGSTPFGSTVTLHSFGMDGNDAGDPSEPPMYSYLQTGVTPISFKGIADDYPTDIIDLKDADQTGNGSDDSWLDANNSKFDAWYGMKPYNVMGSSNRKDSDAHVPNSDPVASGPTSSALQTKQKLLYSRFARRPQSESVLRMRGRPPLPPGKDVKLRPTSETQRKTQTFSRYLASDLDIR